jgi:Domain of unknown function (DUF4062)
VIQACSFEKVDPSMVGSMDINVFVSSTCRDMTADCRPAALRAIRFADDILRAFGAGRAAPVAMEDWDADYEPPLQLCLEKIRADSTHYVGILGYLRGFVPGEGAVSITEAEWRHALEHRGPSCIAMFVPRVDSPFAKELQRRASALQTDAELEAQEKFRDEVLREGTAMPFEDIAELGGRVIRKVVLWAKGGLREAARASQVDNGAAAPRRRPSISSLTKLGRLEQLTVFLDMLQRLSLPGTKNAVVFLVYGPHGFGHLQLISRLVQEVVDNSYQPPRRFVASAGALWRENGQAALLHALGREIRSGWEPAQISDLAAELLNLLRDQDVIVQISGLEGHAGGPAAFLGELWGPLTDALPPSIPNRLICLAAVETEDETLDLSFPGCDAVNEPYRPARPVLLPRLRWFTLPEVSTWLRPWLRAPDVDFLSQRLMDWTKGMPDALYAVLADPALWEQ